MAKMTLRPWEQALGNIKLVPKMVILMVFSTLLIVGKQLWDAETFRQSLNDFTHAQTQLEAERTAALAASLQSQPSGTETIASTLKRQNQVSNSDITFLVDTKSGQLLGHPSATRVDQLNAKLEQGGVLGSALKTATGMFEYIEQASGKSGVAVPVSGSQWVAVASKTADAADDYYTGFLYQIAWQTVVMIGCFMVVLLSGAGFIIRQIRHIADGIRAMAKRDLSQPIEMDCKDEFGDLTKELETARCHIASLLDNQRGSSSELSVMAEQMTVAMEQTHEAAREQFAEIDQLASAMSEMSSTVQDVAGHARAASDATESSRAQAYNGKEYVRKTIDSINKLSSDLTESANVVNQVEDRVEKISSIVVTIQGISEQTNLLALNAAIESARAGEAGRGFSVVADEVRNLAQHTQKATVEIQKMIDQLQDIALQAVTLMRQSVAEADDSVESVSKAGEELELIVDQIAQVNDMNFQIASAASQQASVADEMNVNLTSVKELVHGSVNVVSELSETSGAIKKNAHELDEKIKGFVI
ncbi:methyl-accepting chemotaxis protein [Veronia nyctiphanis]|uniref:Methyl-accepting chemotaxis protein n=1 Tax=Veronia nyctiphanis TaxID=1278244 RepID=A0A4Q0YII5_9GAMM|nr:methyl-accepting chemotaxis protein [Veronia nyctiphanis]RXJ70510.1 methyl-accepting chemotaxis protein [Veronia nyctiphanis]